MNNLIINIISKKDLVKTVVVLITTIVFTQSCVLDKGETPDKYISQTLEADISLNTPTTKADGNIISEAEYNIKKVRIMIFNRNQNIERNIIIDTLASFNTLKGGILRLKIPFNIAFKNSSKVCVLVNEPDTLSASLNKIRTISALDAVKYEIDHIMKTPAYRIKGGTLENPDFYIPFYGELFVNIYSHYTEGRLAPIIIKVKRIVARIDVYVRKSDALKADATIGDYTTLNIMQVAKESFITPVSSDKNITPTLIDKSEVLIGPSPEIKVPFKNSYSYGTHIFSFYVPEFYISNADFGFMLKNVKISDGRSKNYSILVGKGESNQVVKITRNIVYKMLCTLDDSEHPLEIYYSNWGEEERRIVFN